MAKTIGQLTAVTTFNPSTDEFVIEQSGQTFKVAASVVRGGLVNANIDAAAAIVYSKLNLANSIVAGDITSAAVTPAKLSQPFTLRTAQNSTSGTSIDFTGIPSWAKRVTVLINGVSTNGTSNLIIQLGTSSGFQTSSYGGSAMVSQAGIIGNTAFSTGFLIDATTLAADVRSGVVSINLVGGDVWAAAGNVSLVGAARTSCFSGTIGLSGTLTQVRVTTVSGTDDFDAGSINISYEG